MSYAIITNALKVSAEKLVVPQSPPVQSKTADDVLVNLNSALEDLRVHYDRISRQSSLTNGALFLVDAINEVENAVVDIETIAGYITDLRGYARFWRRLAQKFIAKHEPNRPVIYKPFNEI